MALLAALYGIVSGNGIWYAMNLLVAGLFPAVATQTASQIGTFNLQEFLVAVPLHLVMSLLVGLLYGAMLPMLPRRPIALGGVVTPLLWSGLIYGILAFVNPVMNQHIHWVWFVASQIAFGIVAGLVVVFQERIPTRQPVPLTLRMGIEAPGLMHERQERKQ
jgi:NhaP-type Na+/H+ or K+/H+ antiporter